MVFLIVDGLGLCLFGLSLMLCSLAFWGWGIIQDRWKGEIC